MPIWADNAPQKLQDALAREPVSTYWSPHPVVGFRRISVRECIEPCYLDHFRTLNGHLISHHAQGSYSAVWDLGLLTSVCSQPSLMGHEGSPGWMCDCGIYAVKDLRQIDAGPGYLYTLVAMTEVVEHELGYRAGAAWVIACTGTGSASAQAFFAHTPVVTRSLPKLARVGDYFSKNPEEIPRPADEAWERLRKGPSMEVDPRSYATTIYVQNDVSWTTPSTTSKIVFNSITNT